MTSQICGSNYRIMLLTERLVRLEYHPQGCFEDRPTTFARNRDFPPVNHRVYPGEWGVMVDTPYLHLCYDEKEFTPHGLCISLTGEAAGHGGTWHYGEVPETLGGTARTLDEVNGECEVGPGVISRTGIAILDDGDSPLLLEDGSFLPRPKGGKDIYFFGYGLDYEQCLKDFYALSGPVPLLPRYALGNWWSRYHAYTQESYLELMDHFERERIPLSVAVIDMDWHIVDNPYHSGWTGYTWNEDLFPDPRAFLKTLHKRRLKVTLNLHPAEGVAPHEKAYPELCRALGLPPNGRDVIDFDPTDKNFLRAYLEVLHHPLEEEGVDFWWMDWQQGTVSKQEGLDPLWVLNVLHYEDSKRKDKRGLILSRYAGPGSHRYPIGFSGDTIMTWESLDFQPRFTSMASNIGYPWWSHDIGGHMGGIRNDELSVRWLWLGVFSPILRLHSSKSEFMSKEPWSFGHEAGEVMKKCLQLRHHLLPYLYTAMERTHREGIALVRPLYHEWPRLEEAYQFPNQFLFGPSLMVCPITTPADPALGYAKVRAYLPKGLWYDMETGMIYSGERILTLHRDLSTYPVLAPAGAILPLDDCPSYIDNPWNLEIVVFAGKSGSYVLYEDDDKGEESSVLRTTFTLDWEKKTLSFDIAGDTSLIDKYRRYKLTLVGFPRVPVYMDGSVVETTYDENRNALAFRFLFLTEHKSISFSFPEACVVKDDWKRRTKERLSAAQTSNIEKDEIWSLLSTHPRNTSLLGTLMAKCQTPGLFELLYETIFAQEE